MAIALPLGRVIEPSVPTRAGDRDLPILSMTMRGGLVDQSSKFKKRIASRDTANYKVVKRNELVVGFPIDEGVLSFQRIYEEAIVSPAYDIWKIRDGAEVEPAYLEKFLRSPLAIAFYKAKLRGTTARRRTLPDDVFLMLSVPVPDTASQRRIATVLDQAEALRVKRKEANAKLNTLLQSLFQHTFPELMGRGDTALPTVGDAIAGGAIVEIQDGNHGEKHPKVGDFTAEGLPFITANCLANNTLNLADCYRLSPSWLNHLRIGFASAHDVLLSHKGSVGLVAIVPEIDQPLILSPQVTYYRLNQDLLHPQFVKAFFLTEYFQAKIKKDSEQSTRSYIGVTRQLNLPLPIPKVEVQKEFARKVGVTQKLAVEQDAFLKRTDDLFASLQCHAFRRDP
jgi:type I restriction enzyme, S subunit